MTSSGTNSTFVAGKLLTSAPGNEIAPMALLLAAHGERKAGATNLGVVQLAANLRARAVAQEVAVGFIKGTPTIAESVRALHAQEIVVYPFFLSDGYFTRTRLPQILNEAARVDQRRRFRILPPLGADPSLEPLLIDRLVRTAQGRLLAPAQADVILLAHGSRNDPASRLAAERIAAGLRRRTSFRTVRAALLEEPPSLAEVTSELAGPIIVLGLFAGEGMHGSDDAPRLVRELGRADAVFVGTLAQLEPITELIGAAFARAAQHKEGVLIV